MSDSATTSTDPTPPETPGVYAADADGSLQLVHPYQLGDYGLEDVAESFQLGRLEEASEKRILLLLDKRELRELKVMADAYSFDYEEEFIEMCLAMHRFGEEQPRETYRFIANF